MNEITHLISDFVTIVLLILIAIYSICSFLVMFKIEKKFEELYFSLYLFSISLFLLFDNTTISKYYAIPGEGDLNVPIVTFIGFLIFVTSSLYLMEINSMKPATKKYLYYSYIVLFICPVLSCFKRLWSINFYGYFILYSFILLALINLIYIGFYIRLKKNYLSIKVVLNYLGIIFISLYIIAIKYYLEVSQGSYKTPGYFTILFPVFIFIYLLAKEKNDEYLELIELRRIEGSRNKIDIDLLNKKYNLSKKESLVAQGLCNGRLYKEISCETEISISYVKKLVNSLYKKCQVNNRSELLNLAYNLKK